MSFVSRCRLNTPIPSSRQGDSVWERVETLDDNYTATRAGYLDYLLRLAGLLDVVIYPVAEDMGTAEITDDGTSPALTAEVSQTNKTEAEAEAAPAWTEDIDFEQDGTIDIISIYCEFHWEQQFTVGAGAGTTTNAKLQISGDGGTTWVDVTDNVAENNAAYQPHARIGDGRHITAITGGANQLQLRLCAWTDDATGVSTVETKIRSDSYIRVTYRKS